MAGSMTKHETPQKITYVVTTDAGVVYGLVLYKDSQFRYELTQQFPVEDLLTWQQAASRIESGLPVFPV